MIAASGFLAALECTKFVTVLGQLTTLPQTPRSAGGGAPFFHSLVPNP